MIGAGAHADMVLACDVVLNTSADTPDRDLFSAVEMLGDIDRPHADFEAQMRVIILLWLRDELGREAVMQVRAKHAAP